MKKNLTIFLVLITFFSCDKKNDLAANQSKPKLQTDLLQGPCPYDCHDVRCQAYSNGYCGTPPPPPPTTITPVSNPNNPYDYVGATHNSGVDYAFNLVTANTSHSYPYLQNLTNKYLATKNYDTVFANNAINAAKPLYYTIPDTAYATNPASLVTLMYSNGAIDNATYGYLLNICLAFKNDIGDKSPSTSVYNTFANHILNIENPALTDTRLTPLDLRYVLSAASIARYSAAYWGSFQLNSGSTQLASVGRKLVVNTTAAKPFNWGNVGKADFAGAVGGAIGGAVVGASGGPATAAAGAVTGAVAGGLGNSVTVAVMQWFNW